GACLGAGPGVEINDGRHRDLDPFLTRPDLDGRAVAGAARRAPGLRGKQGAAVVVEASGIDLGAQHPADSRGLPYGPSFGGRDLFLREADHDPPYRQRLIGVEVKDPAHHRRLGLADLEAGGQAVCGRDLAVAVGDLAGDDGSLARLEELAPTVALHDLGPLELRYRGLDLHREATGGIFPEARLAQDHLHPEP